MRRMLTQNLGWKLLSVALAFALWAAVGHDPETGTSVAARVQYKNLADDLDISDGLPEDVTLELRGPSRRLQQNNLSSVSVLLDFARLGQRVRIAGDDHLIARSPGGVLREGRPGTGPGDQERRGGQQEGLQVRAPGPNGI